MTEETGGDSSQNDIADEDSVRKIRDELLPYDPTFENLVMLIALMDTAEVGVTIHVKGAVVSGMLISPRRFFKMLIATLSEGVKSNAHAANTAQAFADFYTPVLKGFEDSIANYNESDVSPPRPHHVHLRNVLTYVTGAEPLVQRLWRGRLTEIDGWSVGNFGGRPPELPKELW